MRSSPNLVPTRPSGDNSNAPASTAFVAAAVAAGGSSVTTIFSATAVGFVPASGGSSLNVLYADATFRALPAAASQTVRQVLQVVRTSTGTLGTQIPFDDTIPSTSEGTEIFSQALIPNSTFNRVLVDVSVWGGSSVANQNMIIAIFRDSTCIQVQAAFIAAAQFTYSMFLNAWDTPGSTASVTYHVRGGNNGTADLYINGNNLSRAFGGAASCTLTLTEVSST